ncbi:MAG: hypothetical protein FWC62_08765 [Firmicutes bacterium]|nr:hypothetical protein [Bacillota bacterium]
MHIFPVFYGDTLWEPLADYAERCGWSAGPTLARRMRQNGFSERERVFVALSGGDIAGYCILTNEDCIPNAPYTPYIGFVFVGSHTGDSA